MFTFTEPDVRATRRTSRCGTFPKLIRAVASGLSNAEIGAALFMTIYSHPPAGEVVEFALSQVMLGDPR